jgi:hypothetical protein
MNLEEKTFQTYVLRPLVVLWAVLAIGVLAAVIVDALAPEGRSPVAGFFKYRVNTTSAEWAAVAEAQRQMQSDRVPGQAVLVDTDNGIFFYLLRYQLYPTWVLRSEWLTPEGATAADPLIAAHIDGIGYVVTYREGNLVVKRVQP